MIGQPAPQLSGGEAQRVKLSRELAKPGTGSTLYIPDEPTTGLHFSDIEKLLHVLERLVEAGNTVLVVDLEVIAAAEHEAGECGTGCGRRSTRRHFHSCRTLGQTERKNTRKKKPGSASSLAKLHG